MPATEQTWRDSKRMHLIFGISALLMLVTTIWMLAVDHRREWKDYQRSFRDVEASTIEYRIRQEETNQYQRELKEREEALAKTRVEVPPKELVDEFKKVLFEEAKQREVDPPNFENVEKEYQELADLSASAGTDEKAAEDIAHRRSKLILDIEQFVADAKFRESNFLREKKFEAAIFDVARSDYELGIGNGLSAEKLAELEQKVQTVKEDLDKKALRVENAKTQRQELERIFAEIIFKEAQARKALDEQIGKLKQLTDALEERENNWAKDVFAMPIIDAFGRPLKPEQIWLPKLTINYNFRDVPRFDRCTTCHLGLDKTAPGSAIDPAYSSQHEVELSLVTPEEAPPAELELDQILQKKEEYLNNWFGLRLADHGMLDASDVTLSVVRPESLGAKAGLNAGDVLLQIGTTPVVDKKTVYRYLLDDVNWGKPIKVTVQRGLPNPFTSHPRLDLFVGSLSPHKLQEVGCTICHEGQGSATDFKWASHSPNDPGQATRWKHDHGWFNNHHWIFPMNPKRFAESSCLKCHHEVAELEPSERFPEPPAPKLLAGYDLIRQNGCFGCHEINGYDGPNKRIGPDLRTEPNYSAAAQALLASGALDKNQEVDWAQKVVEQPSDDKARRSLLESLRVAMMPSAESKRKISGDTRRLATVLEDVESPGKLRKVGPSLRHVASKVDYEFLYSWIRKPKDFRPTTKMPQFFGLWKHLDGEGLKTSERYEPLEIRGIAEYLLAKSQPYEYATMQRGVERASVERGKKSFETRGCLACHQHAAFPKGQMSQGPDLTNLGAKLDRKANPNGRRWLYSWLRNPNSYHPRTLMPNLILDPVEDEQKRKIDPAADIAAFLLSSKDWKPTDVASRQLSEEERKALYDLAFENLKAAYPKRQAEEYLEKGIPDSLRGEIKGDEIELVGADSVEQKQLLYVGRRAISKYGCSGCHDVPGYEDVKPIGTGLADWGRKAADKLAFEQITQYIMHGHGPHTPKPASKVDAHDAAYQGPHSTEGLGDEVELLHAEGGHNLNFENLGPSIGYFMQKLFGHEREGFIWQKLREPRSYDYKKTENKGYNERLRMPQFKFNNEQREQIVTFVLGLVAEPPATQYVYKPTPRRAAIVEGQKVIEKFNCKGCHAFQMERWDLAYDPGDFSDPPKFEDFAFLDPHFTPQQIQASLKVDSRGLRHATLVGMPMLTETTGEPEQVDSDGSPIEAEDTESPVFEKFVLFDNALINGKIRPSGLQNLLVPMARVEKQYPTPGELKENPAGFGGYLARLIFPTVLADERVINPNAKGDDAWAWLPPPLVGEGRKVQTDWLHNFLLDPYPIRPAVVLRMPKFNMSSGDASALVNYFAAVDNADYPYDFDPRTREGYLTSIEKEQNHPHRLADGMKVITDNNYCVKCHLLGDFVPGGSKRAMGPQLDDVYKRLRPEYTLRWIANPKRILPYTGMPVNIPFNKPVSQSLYHGDSIEQLNAVVDLLLNFNRFIESRTSMKSFIKPAAATPAEGPPPGAGSSNSQPGGGAMIATRFLIDRRVRRTCFMAAILLAALIPVVGCGKPAPPPPGAEEKTDEPDVDLGNDSDKPADKQGDK